MSISHSDLMPIRAERSDAGLSQCETVIDIRQDLWRFSLPWGAGGGPRRSTFRFHSPDPAGTPPHGARTVFQVQRGQGGLKVEARSGDLACVLTKERARLPRERGLLLP